MAYYRNKMEFEQALNNATAFGPQFQKAVYRAVCQETRGNYTYTRPADQVALDRAVQPLTLPPRKDFKSITWPEHLTDEDKQQIKFWLDYPYIMNCSDETPDVDDTVDDSGNIVLRAEDIGARKAAIAARRAAQSPPPLHLGYGGGD